LLSEIQLWLADEADDHRWRIKRLNLRKPDAMAVMSLNAKGSKRSVERLSAAGFCLLRLE
jgi:hypothetical protein